MRANHTIIHRLPGRFVFAKHGPDLRDLAQKLRGIGYNFLR